MHVQIDQARCEGHGMCEDAAPEVFRVDDDGMAQLLRPEIVDGLARAAEAGVRACPVAALKLVPW